MPDQVASSITEQLIDRGSLGIIVLVFAMVIVYLWRDGKADRVEFFKKLEDLHDKRLNDMKEGGTQMQAVVRESTSTLAAVTTALDKSREATLELRTALRDLGEDMRALAEEVRRKPIK